MQKKKTEWKEIGSWVYIKDVEKKWRDEVVYEHRKNCCIWQLGNNEWSSMMVFSSYREASCFHDVK